MNIDNKPKNKQQKHKKRQQLSHFNFLLI